jgi:tyrosyl-tRNA synthetase
MDKDKAIQTILEKGVSEILPNKAFLNELLLSGKKLSIYAGFDPTAPSLHIGHAVQLRKLRQFQDLGHQIIFLVGDFTARIGDPTDKLAVRTQLTEKEIKTNLKLYKKQASKFIRFEGKNAAKIKFNNTWLGKMKFADVISLASYVTVDQMLKRDMFVKRMNEEKPIYLHEFFYPLMQGYDSVVMEVDGEVGGNDQLFNMMAGRTLLKQMKNKEKFVITMKLLEDGNGKKMSKSEGNAVSLIDEAHDIYGKVMSWPDGLIIPGFELCTNASSEQMQEIQHQLQSNTNPRDIKMKLAFETVKDIHGEKKAQEAQETFVSTFQKREVVTEFIKTVSIKEKTFETLFIEEELVLSKTELRRLVESNAVTNFDTKNTLTLEDIKKEALPGVYKIGKNRFIRLVVK